MYCFFRLLVHHYVAVGHGPVLMRQQVRRALGIAAVHLSAYGVVAVSGRSSVLDPYHEPSVLCVVHIGLDYGAGEKGYVVLDNNTLDFYRELVAH